LADRDLTDRTGLLLPPPTSMALVTGQRRAVTAVAEGDLPDGVAALGPVLAPDGSARLVLRAPHAAEEALSAYLLAVRRTSTARKDEDIVSIRMRIPDPTV